MIIKGDAIMKLHSPTLKNKFMELNKDNKDRRVYPYSTCATDTDNIDKVFTAVKDYILTTSLRMSGFIVGS